MTRKDSIFCVLLLVLVHSASATRADIYQWEYIDQANPGLGKRQSAMLAPGGSGIDALPDADLEEKNLNMAYLIGADLREVNLVRAQLAFADFTGANLYGANLQRAHLDQAVFTDSNIQYANFRGTTSDEGDGFTADQFYSTASYKSGQLGAIGLEDNDHSGWTFSGKNLSNSYLNDSNFSNADFSHANLSSAMFYFSNLTNADFTGANVQNANLAYTVGYGLTSAQIYSTATYQSGELSRVNLSENDLSGWNFADKDLSSAGFYKSNVTNADFTNSEIRGAWLARAIGFSAVQLYSTASYKAGDLTGINLEFHPSLAGWDFAGQNLTKASLDYADVTDADFTGARIDDASFYDVRGLRAEQIYSTTSYLSKNLAGVNLSDNYLAGWNLAGQNLQTALFNESDLTNADFSQADLTSAAFRKAKVSGANFSGANITGAYFGDTLGLTEQQLYSTASYQSKDLHGINVQYRTLSGWNFAGQNLSYAQFQYAKLNDANLERADFSNAYLAATNLSDANLANSTFTDAYLHRARLLGANLAGAEILRADFSETTSLGFTATQLYSTASYQDGDLSGLRLLSNDMRGWDFSDLNLYNVNFRRSTLAGAIFRSSILAYVSFEDADLTDADFTDADVRNAKFYQDEANSFSPNQLYSTASYQSGDLSGIWVNAMDLAGWDFAGFNLVNASFGDSTLVEADFRGADTRGGNFRDFDGVIDTNMIRPDGRIQGLQLTDEQSLRIRNYDTEAPYAIDLDSVVVTQRMEIDATGVLQFQFDKEEWRSRITFEPGIDVLLGGVLELDFAEEANVESLFGRTIQVFDWTGVSPIGEFKIASPYSWDISKLYTTGEIRLLPEPSSAAILVLTSFGCVAFERRRRLWPGASRSLLPLH